MKTLFSATAVALSVALTISTYAQDAGSAEMLAKAQEEGSLLIYSNASPKQWQPIVDGFKAGHSGIDVQIIDLGGELFARYYAESGSGAPTADLILAGGEDSWFEFVQGEHLLDYESPELVGYPDWANPYPGLYTLSSDPSLMIYNRALIKDEDMVSSLAELKAFMEANPDTNIATITATRPFGQASHWSWYLHNKPDSWDTLEPLVEAAQIDVTAGTLVEKVITGEHALAFFVSGAVVLEKTKDAAFASVIGYRFITDGTPIIPRRIGITADAAHENAAKLMIDYILSEEGQTLAGKAGFTPVRAGVDKSAVAFNTLETLAEAASGAENLAIDSYSAELAPERAEFLARWEAVADK